MGSRDDTVPDRYHNDRHRREHQIDRLRRNAQEEESKARRIEVFLMFQLYRQHIHH